MGLRNGLIKITFPSLDGYEHQVAFYRDLNLQFDKGNHVYGEDYLYYWNDNGKYIPDYLKI
jgi:hypothetical protein